jgi:hypothetical protein
MAEQRTRWRHELTPQGGWQELEDDGSARNGRWCGGVASRRQRLSDGGKQRRPVGTRCKREAACQNNA